MYSIRLKTMFSAGFHRGFIWFDYIVICNHYLEHIFFSKRMDTYNSRTGRSSPHAGCKETCWLLAKMCRNSCCGGWPAECNNTGRNKSATFIFRLVSIQIIYGTSINGSEQIPPNMLVVIYYCYGFQETQQPARYSEYLYLKSWRKPTATK